jgi:hypothetical protein
MIFDTETRAVNDPYREERLAVAAAQGATRTSTQG